MNLFTDACRALWGSSWQTEASRQLEIALSSVVRYSRGDRPPPPIVYHQLTVMTERRRRELARIAERIDRAVR